MPSIIFDKISARTALGEARQTCEGLLNNEIALKLTPILGSEGGDCVPLALTGPMNIQAPPRWWKEAIDFYHPFHEEKWGRSRFPVIVTSSNFGIDALYGIGRTREAVYAQWATSDRCVGQFATTFGWGANVTLISHACVSAQLGILQAKRLLENDLADAVLLFSFDFVGPFVAAGFNSLKILNDQMPAPYVQREIGSIGLGDGIAAAVLKKGNSGWAVGNISTWNEMYHFTANKPDASGFHALLAPFVSSLKNRSFWIKGHGTGTLDAGKMEATSTFEAFPDAPLVSWKGSIGHTLGSCALVELAIAIAAMEIGRIPGNSGSHPPFFAENVTEESFDASPYDECLLLSNAFGGAHAAMSLRHV